jgi:hypothetical protein
VALVYKHKGSALKPTVCEFAVTFDSRLSKAVTPDRAPLDSS